MNIFRQIIIIYFLIVLSVSTVTAEVIKDTKPNILLFTIDACRFDHLSCYGYSRKTTPNIDKLAGEGIIFTNAFSQSAWTTPSMLSIFTSLHPPAHNVDAKGKTLKEDIETLPEVLKQKGYVIPVLPRFVDIPNYWHLGFDAVDKKQFSSFNPEEVEDLIKLIETYRDQRFFIWYHYHGLHLPYNPPDPYDKLFMKAITTGTVTESTAILDIKKKSVIKNGSVNFKDEDKSIIVSLYDGQVKQMDDDVGKIIGKIKEFGILDNTLIILTSDHGEELLEHGFVGHASTSLNAKLYDEIIHIPLIIWYPKILKHKKIEDIAQQIDIMPTVLDLLEISVPDGLQGHSLLPLIQKQHSDDSNSSAWSLAQETVFCETILGGYQSTKEMEQIKMRCLRTKEWKLIYTKEPDSYKYELYDLKTDPNEQRNVIEKYPDVRSELRKKLQYWIETTQPR